jgi:methyl-accepting chemotaxis protein
MAIQILPIIKAVAPYVAQVATAAIPAFTTKAAAGNVNPVVAKQIEELQSAATQNAEAIHVLAETMQETIDGMEQAARQAKKELAFYKTLVVISVTLSVLATSMCVYLLTTT